MSDTHPRPLRAPQARLNAAVIRAERRTSRQHLAQIAFALLITLALLQAARIALGTALALPDLIATTAERNLP